MKHCLLYSVIILFLLSCYKKEAPLAPSALQTGYVVPQGNHDYDEYIVQFYKKYDKYILYDFADKDVYWTPTGWRNPVLSSGGIWTAGPEVSKADPAYVGNQLKLLDTTWFKYYSDNFIRDFFPVKIMLASAVDSIYPTIVSFTPVTLGKGVTAVAGWFNYDNISVNYGTAEVKTLTPQQVKKIGAKLHLVLMQSLNERKRIAATASFTAVANYGLTMTSQANAYAQGIICPYNSSPNSNLDWSYYMMAMVSMNEASLTISTPATNTGFMGILHATKDVNGRIKQRYNMVRTYYKEKYGVDLQTIGNTFN